MTEPIYMHEKRYSHHYKVWPRYPLAAEYEVKTAQTDFEKNVMRIFQEGENHLQHDEYVLALNAFRELQNLILMTAHPTMKADPVPVFWVAPMDPSLIDVIAQKSADILKNSIQTTYNFPATVISEMSILPVNMQQELRPLIETEIQINSPQRLAIDGIDRAIAASEKNDWPSAMANLSAAIQTLPVEEKSMRASILHDMAVISEEMGKNEDAIKYGEESAKLFSESTNPEPHIHSLSTLKGLYERGGKVDSVKNVSEKLNVVTATRSSSEIERPEILRPSPTTAATTTATRVSDRTQPGTLRPATGTRIEPHAATDAATAPSGTAALPPATPFTSTLLLDSKRLMGTRFLDVQKSFLITHTANPQTIILDNNAVNNIKGFHQKLASLDDVSLITGFWRSPKYMIAYLVHMYFFVIPMSIGDCLMGLGNLLEAETQYRSILVYPYINGKYEIVKLWTNLANVYLEMGDEAYKTAKDNVALYSQAKAIYENIVLFDGTLNANSPLYQDQKFADVKGRVTAILSAADPVVVNDNPSLAIKVLEARTKLSQIASGLNFFGLPPDYLPPFSFEYLQNTARYFAQHASQIEQQYIQYKTSAESEEFRREQLDQQAEVARQTVTLEQRGVVEAQATINVAQASLNYAEVQLQGSIAAKNDFDNVRWELLEIAEAEAWASAASMDEDDEIKQTWRGNYYNSRSKRRSLVLQDLAYRRSRISHDLEASKLERAIDSANAYKGISQAQVGQAQARRQVAEQRVKIAQLQQRHAEENRDYLDMKEFGTQLWFDLSREARRLSKQYLDMAIEIALLMERAYNAETERGLNVIRLDYQNSRTRDLMGGDFLLRDIDYFTLDYVTTTKTKKVPIKKVISIADFFPMAFYELKTKGKCFFQTEMADFEFDHPGLYLCKLRNVELIFVGVTGAGRISGSLRNVGVSRFRRENGSIITRLYPSDVMPLSQYDIRQDALTFRFNPNDLRLFENNGIDTLWQLELPFQGNDFDFNNILDIQLVMYYDGFFSQTLEAQIKTSLPSSGSSSRSFSMQMMFQDELFYLKNKGDAEIVFEAGMFPFNHTALKRKEVTIKAVGSSGSSTSGLKMRLLSSESGSEITVNTDANGEASSKTSGSPLGSFVGRPLLDKWLIRLTKEDNPQLVKEGSLDLSGIGDIVFFIEYDFTYRTSR